MGNSRVGCCSMWVVAALVLASATAAAAEVSCGDAVNALIPCGSYLVGQGGGDPSPECCRSAQGLSRMATTTASRRELCQCLVQTGPSFGVRPERARHLPPFCKLDLKIPISPTVDCNRIA